MDPWGYPYTLEEALGFTSSDVLSMGIQLLETPFPVTAFIGLYLLTATSLPRGMGVLLAWAILPVSPTATTGFMTCACCSRLLRPGSP